MGYINHFRVDRALESALKSRHIEHIGIKENRWLISINEKDGRAEKKKGAPKRPFFFIQLDCIKYGLLRK